MAALNKFGAALNKHGAADTKFRKIIEKIIYAMNVLSQPPYSQMATARKTALNSGFSYHFFSGGTWRKNLS
jgi:hypothetical protein